LTSFAMVHKIYDKRLYDYWVSIIRFRREKIND